MFVATAPTVYGIETSMRESDAFCFNTVATAPTVYGIETDAKGITGYINECCNSTYRLRY